MTRTREQIKQEIGDIFLASVNSDGLNRQELHTDFEKYLIEYVYDIANAPQQATDITLMMMSKAREIDRELILELGNIVGQEKLLEVAKLVTGRHKYFKDGQISEIQKETEAPKATEEGAGNK